MTVGALITAAGMSSRMGDFKPMLSIGSISIAQRIVANFRQAGVDRIVVVTGYKATALERHLSGNGVEFLRNEKFETTTMFDSAKLGLEYLRDKVDIILFSPVDIPLFKSSTVEALLESPAALARPVCRGEDGHPIKISASLVDGILADSGEGGLRGALSRSGESFAEIPVQDEGILHDADTPDDYTTLLSLHNAQLIRAELSISLSKELPFFDEKLAMLLSLVKETSSVRSACQRMQISYSTGWNILKTLETQLSKTLIVRTQGGPKGSFSGLTPAGEELLARFESYTKALREYAAAQFDSYFGSFFDSGD